MNARNYSVVAVILLIVAAIVGFLAFKVNTMSDGIKAFYEEKKTSDLALSLNERDYEIYWIGTLPQYMDMISENVTLLTVNQASFNTLPVIEGNSELTVYDKNGNVIQHREKRDYASSMLIVINTNEEIPDEKWDVIRNCVVNNHVPLLLIGDNNIYSFREYMIMLDKTYEASSTMFFEFSSEALDNPIDPSIVEAGGRDYANSLLEFFISVIDNPVIVYVSSETIPPTTAVETNETEEILEETEIMGTLEESNAA